MKVEYRDVPGFPGYRVGDDGSVWSCWQRGVGSHMTGRWRLMKANPVRGRTLQVELQRGGKPINKRVHTLILEAFVGPCPPGMEACHADDNQSNNRLTNLRWDTHKANCADRSRNGRTAKGSRHGKAKHDEATIRRVKKLLAEGYRPTQIERITGVDWKYVCDVKRGRTWAHLQLEVAK